MTIVLLFAFAILMPAGCGRKMDPELPPKVDANKAVPKIEPPKVDAGEKPKKPPVGFLKRRFDVAELQNLLRQVGIAHVAYVAEKNRSPNAREDLASSYENNAKINQLLTEGDVIVMWKSLPPEEPSRTVLAYEASPDGAGLRLVVTFDGAVALVPEAEFQKMPKPQQRK